MQVEDVLFERTRMDIADLGVVTHVRVMHVRRVLLVQRVIAR